MGLAEWLKGRYEEGCQASPEDGKEGSFHGEADRQTSTQGRTEDGQVGYWNLNGQCCLGRAAQAFPEDLVITCVSICRSRAGWWDESKAQASSWCVLPA